MSTAQADEVLTNNAVAAQVTPTYNIVTGRSQGSDSVTINIVYLLPPHTHHAHTTLAPLFTARSLITRLSPAERRR